MKILPVRAVLFSVYGQTYGEINSRFSQFCERVKTCSVQLDSRHVTVAGCYEASRAAVTPGRLQLCSVLQQCFST